MKSLLSFLLVILGMTGMVFASYECPIMAGGFSNVVGGFILLAVGYWVLTLSQNQKRPLDVLGRIIGVIILLASLASLISSAFVCVSSCPSKKTECPISAQK
jgi:thiol:disulfide interchange protein